MKFFQLTPLQAAEQLNTDIIDGLSLSQVAQKQEICGKNELKRHDEKLDKSRFLTQFKDLTIIILLVAAVISAIISVLQKDYWELINAALIVAIVIINGVIGMLQEGKAEKALASLERFSLPKARVIRSGQVVEIKTVDLVPGDIVLLEAGDLVPADGRIVECSFLKIDENVLTEESLPAEKSVGIIAGDNHSIGDLCNMAFSGTLVISGTGKMIVTSIGMETQLGKIAGMLHRGDHEKTPLQTQIAQMGRVLSLVALIVCAVMLLLGIIEGKPIIDMLLTVVSLAVASIPEGLLATVTVMLAFGVRQLAKKGVIVRKLGAVEALGNIEVICTDKTGTLTKNEMNVVSCYVKGEHLEFAPKNYKKSAELILYGSMCNDAFIEKRDGRSICIGDPTEGAIISALKTFGKDKHFLDKQYPRMGVIPFDRDRKCKSTIHVIGGRNLVIVKGTPDVLFEKCTNQAYVDEAIKAEEEMAKQGLRVLAVAVKEIDVIPSELFVEEIESDLVLVGLIGITDALHSETSHALRACKKAGIRTVMLSGDQSVTAKAAAEQMGIFVEGDTILDGQQLDAMSDEEFLSCIENCSVYARITPEQRVRVVNTWQKLGKNVAVTGDRSSDAPALQRADIGCAMGVSGVDVAKDAADIVVLDDSFATIVTAIRQGRGVYNNIKKTVRFLLSGNLSEVLVILAAMLMLFNVPLLPLHLLWINVLTNALPALALGMETAREGLMNRPPRSKKESLITKSITVDVLWQGALIAVVSLLGYVFGTGFLPRTQDLQLISTGRTMAFAILAFSQIFHAFDSRSRHSILKIGAFGNRWLNLSALASVVLILFVMLTPGVSSVFGIASLNFVQWLTILGLSLIPFVCCEIVKLIKKR